MRVCSQLCTGFLYLEFLRVFFILLKNVFSNVPQGLTQKRTKEKVPLPFPDLCILTRNMYSNPVGMFPLQEDDSTSLELREGDFKSGGELVTATIGATVMNMGQVGGLTSRRT